MPKDSAAKFTAVPELESTSESEEMYLITVARAIEDGSDRPVPVAVIAKRLQVSVASANEMVRKLVGRGMLDYEPYHGVELSPAGTAIAQRVLRTRRLWGTFLADHLGLTPTEADDQACLLEHVTLADAVDRLADFLGDPATGPLGHPIPRLNSRSDSTVSIRLGDLGIGGAAEIIAVSCPDQARAFLASEGLVPGARVSVIGVGEAGLLLAVDGHHVNVSSEIAASIEVDKGA